MTIVRNGKEIKLTNDEREMIYEEVKFELLCITAARYLTELDGDDDSLLKEFGVSLDDVTNPDSPYYLLEDLANSYEFDPELSDRTVWESLCKEHLSLLNN